MTSDKIYKFIIIDDHPLIRDGIKDFIKSNNRFEFIGDFSEIREVVNSTFAGRPDVIILDLNLGNSDGTKYCSSLKQRFPECKIVAFTHYEGRDKELIRLGFDGYVVKSEKDLLIEALLTVLKGDKYFKNSSKTITPYSNETDNLDTFLKIKQLTAREIEVAKYIRQDFSNREIGEKLYISESTVETHRKHIKEKLKTGNRRELNEILRGL